MKPRFVKNSTSKYLFVLAMEISSGNDALDQQLSNWLEWDQKGSESYLKVQTMIEEKDWATLDKLMTKVAKQVFIQCNNC